MIYKKFSFKNYKGIKETIDIVLNENHRLHCIVGKNESGKTTILEAIYDIYSLLKSNKTNNTIKSGKNKDIDKKLRNIKPRNVSFTDKILLEATIYITDSDKTKLGLSTNEIVVQFCYDFKDYSEHSHVLFSRKILTTNENILQNQNKIFSFLSKNIPEIYYYDRFLETIPEEIIFYRSAKVQSNESSKKIQNKEDNETIDREKKKEIAKRWSGVLDDIGRNSNINGFKSFQHDVIDWADNHPGDTTHVDDVLKLINKSLTNKIIKSSYLKNNSISNIEIKVNHGQGFIQTSTIKFSINGEDSLSYTIEQRSLGFQWFLSFALFTLFRRKKDALFLIDEPASNLYPGLQEDISNILLEMTQKENNQVIFTSHSPYLMTKEAMINGYVARNEFTKENQINDIKLYKIQDIDINSQNWQEYARTIVDYYKLNYKFIALTDKNLFVEGYEDWALITVFCRHKINKNISIWQLNGATKAPDKIESAIMNSKDFFVLIDNDLKNDTQKTEYEKTIDLCKEIFVNGMHIKVENKLIRLDKLIPNVDNVVAIQSLFDNEADKQKFCEIAEVPFDNQSDKSIKSSVIKAAEALSDKICTDKSQIEKVSQLIENNISQQTKDNFTKLADAIEKQFNSK